MKLILVNVFSCLIMTSQGGGVTTCNFVRIIPLSLPYLPIPIRTHNEGVRLYVFSSKVFKNKYAGVDTEKIGKERILGG